MSARKRKGLQYCSNWGCDDNAVYCADCYDTKPIDEDQLQEIYDDGYAEGVKAAKKEARAQCMDCNSLVLFNLVTCAQCLNQRTETTWNEATRVYKTLCQKCLLTVDSTCPGYCGDCVLQQMRKRKKKKEGIKREIAFLRYRLFGNANGK